MKKEYRIARGWAVFIRITVPPMIALFVWILVMPFMDGGSPGKEIFFLAPISLGMIALLLAGFIETFMGRFIIGDDKIISTGAFNRKELAFRNIRGFRYDRNYLYFIPDSPELKKIKVSGYTGKIGELAGWAADNFPDLDAAEYLAEEKEILENREFGNTGRDREAGLIKARRTAKILNTASWAIALSTWIYPRCYSVQVVACAALPLTGIVVRKASKGLIRFDEKRNSAFPNLMSTLFIPSCVLALRAIMDYNVFDYTGIWKPAAAVFLVFCFLVLKDRNTGYDFRKAVAYLYISMILIFAAMYSYGFTITTNAVFDRPEPETYVAEVLDKRTSSGKTTTYYLKLGQWGPQKNIKEVSVSSEIYKSKKQGDKAVIRFRHGLYGIPFYYVVREEKGL